MHKHNLRYIFVHSDPCNAIQDAIMKQGWWFYTMNPCHSIHIWSKTLKTHFAIKFLPIKRKKEKYIYLFSLHLQHEAYIWCVLSHSAVFRSLRKHALWLARLLCQDFPGKNTGVGCHSLLQGIFPTQGSKLGLLNCRQILYHLSHHGLYITLS